MRRSDAHTIQSGTPGRELMMRAAKGVFDIMEEKLEPGIRIGIVCGSGNNAGDGYALALILTDAGADVTIIRTGERFSDDGRYYYDRCIERGIKDIVWDKEYASEPSRTDDTKNTNCTKDTSDLSGYDVIVDCLLGTGYKNRSGQRDAKGTDKPDVLMSVIDAVNKCKSKSDSKSKIRSKSDTYVISVDINSGLNGDSGMAGVRGDETMCVISDMTVSVGSYKPGHFLNMAKDVMKDKTNVDIGIGPVSKPYYLIEASDVASAIPDRYNMSNKGTYGYIALIGGSARYSGAIRLAYMAGAAMRSGAGVVKVAVPGSLIHDVAPHILESTLFPMPDKDGEMIYDEAKLKELTGNVKAVAFGMGIGVSEETGKILTWLLKNYTGRLIIDADGLNLMSGLDKELIAGASCDVVLTPHIKEFSRLTGLSIDKIQERPIAAAMEYVRGIKAYTEDTCDGDRDRDKEKDKDKDKEIVLLLKGPSTIITDGNDVYITDKGCPGMATAGSGDVLSGILSATVAYIPKLITAVYTGAYIGGRAGELAEEHFGAVSMIASDTVSCIADVIKEL